MVSITDRIDAETNRPAEQRASFLPPPHSGKIELSSACNFGCSYCSRSINGGDGEEMSPELFTRIIKEMVGLGIKSVGLFFIGESFMCRSLPERIREAKQLGMEYVFITTNGSLATPARVKSCMEAGLDSLKFSLNYADAAQFSDVARVSGRVFDRILDNVKEARKLRDENDYPCRIYASSILYDGEQREKMQRVVDLVSPWLDEHYFLPAFSMTGAATKNGYKVVQGNPGRVGALREPLPCWSLWSYHIDYKGQMIACCFGAGNNEGMVMGDLTKQSFMDAWNSERFIALREAHLAKDVTGTPCEHCVAAG